MAEYTHTIPTDTRFDMDLDSNTVSEQTISFQEEVVEYGGRKLLVLHRTSIDEKTREAVQDLVVPGFIETKMYDSRKNGLRRTTVEPVGFDHEGKIERDLRLYFADVFVEKSKGLDPEKTADSLRDSLFDYYNPQNVQFWR